MKKSMFLSLALLILGVSSVSAADEPRMLRALNVQNAHIETELDRNTELRVNFDWFRDHVEIGGADVRTNTFNLPRVDIRHSFDCKVPLRIGVNMPLSAGAQEFGGGGGSEFLEHSAFGFGNLGITLEAGIVQTDSVDITMYLNQSIPFVHNNLLIAQTLRPQNGVNAYGFQTGLLYQVGMGDHLIWYGDVGYRFDVPELGEVENSVVYYNELVLGMGDNNSFGLSVGLLGNSVFNNGVGTDLRLVPGIIIPIGEKSQLRAGMPFGLTSDSADIGAQISYFTMF